MSAPPLPKRNVEIKARINDMDAFRSKAAELSGGAGEQLLQHDTFFRDVGDAMRLKLRRVNDVAQLIAYSRPDVAGPKTSLFNIAPV